METEDLIAKIKELKDRLAFLTAAARSGREPDNPELFLKAAVPMLVTLENALPELHDAADSLGYFNDPKHGDFVHLIDALEEDLISALAFIDQLKARRRNTISAEAVQ